MHFGIFYARLARLSNYKLLNCCFLHMLCWQGRYNTNITGSTPHTCQLVWAQWASVGIKTLTYTGICICFPPKFSFVVIVIVALKCNEKSLGIKNITNLPFFLLVHSPPVLKHLNISYTKSSSKWIWREIMVELTLIKVSISEDFVTY
jgi:hypothetical protein